MIPQPVKAVKKVAHKRHNHAHISTQVEISDKWSNLNGGGVAEVNRAEWKPAVGIVTGLQSNLPNREEIHQTVTVQKSLGHFCMEEAAKNLYIGNSANLSFFCISQP